MPPVERQLTFGKALRALRVEKEVAPAELARSVEMTQASISRYESGGRLPSPEIVEKIADALGASKRAKRILLDQLHEAQVEVKSARAIARTGLGRRQEEIARIEQKASLFRGFQAAIVPGLLQTPDYARSVFEESGKTGPDVARAITARLDRQAILHDETKHFEFVVTEAVLLWPRENVRTMLAQLDRIAAVAELDTVDFSVLPLGTILKRTPINSFNILGEDLVLVETFSEQLAIRDSSDIAVYLEAYKDFRAVAVSGPEASRLIASAAARLRQA